MPGSDARPTDTDYILRHFMDTVVGVNGAGVASGQSPVAKGFPSYEAVSRFPIKVAIAAVAVLNRPCGTL